MRIEGTQTPYIQNPQDNENAPQKEQNSQLMRGVVIGVIVTAAASACAYAVNTMVHSQTILPAIPTPTPIPTQYFAITGTFLNEFLTTLNPIYEVVSSVAVGATLMCIPLQTNENPARKFLRGLIFITIQCIARRVGLFPLQVIENFISD